MRNVSRVLRAAYISALSAIEVDGISIPVYDSYAPDNAPDHYIIISDQRSNEIEVKGAFVQSATITLDVVTTFKRNGGKEFSERIADEVLAIIRGGEALVLESGFQSATVRNDSQYSVDELLDDSKIFRTILIFKHKVVQI